MLIDYASEKSDCKSEKDAFQFELFWKLGGFSFQFTENNLLQKLCDQVVKNEKYLLEYNDRIPVEVSSWDTDWSTKCSPPQIYLEIIKYFQESPLLQSYSRIYGEFSFVKPMLHLTPKDYENKYHSHSYDGSHFHVLFYICPETRTINDGGLIEIGVVTNHRNVRFDPIGFYDTQDINVAPLQSYLVQTGFCVCINNLNPYYRHQVTKVFSSKPRYTFMIAFGYSDNCNQNKAISKI